jgi:serine/threonine-protein phosphatase 2A regulatory subunit B
VYVLYFRLVCLVVPPWHSFLRVSYLFLVTDKTIKLWKLTERCKRPEGLNLKDDCGIIRSPSSITTLQVPVFVPVDMMVEASPRRVFANAHAYHINSVSVNSDEEIFLSADDLRINLWNTSITNQSFSILFIH